MTMTSPVEKEHVREVVADALDVPTDTVTDDAAFVDELGIDSLLSLEVVVSLEREFGLKLAEDEMASLTCFADVWALVQARVGS